MKRCSKVVHFVSVILRSCLGRDSLTHPEVVHDLDGLLVLDGNVHGNVVVETRPNGELLWKGGPVVLTTCVSGKEKLTSRKKQYNKECGKLIYL